MENKFNDATPQRPEGKRPIDAPIVLINLNDFKEQIKDEPSWKDSDRNAITMFKSDTFRLVLVALHEGAVLNPHTAKGVISLQVLEGKIKFTTDKETVELEKGQLLVLHEAISHSVEAKKDSTFLLTLAMNAELLSDSAR